MRQKLLALALLLGASAIPAWQASAQVQVGPDATSVQQAQPTPKPTVPAVVVQPKPAGAPTTVAPRAGGFPMELAMPLLAGGAAALGGGAYLLRCGKKGA